MELYEYFSALDKSGREAFAKRANTTIRYLTNHIMKPRPTRIKGASLDYMQRLAEATGGEVDLANVVDHFTNRELYTGMPDKAA